MKRIFCLAVLLAGLTGCARQEVINKQFQSSVNGLPRTIIQYSMDGKELNRWHGRFVVNVDSGAICIRALNLDTDKVYLISAPFLVAED